MNILALVKDKFSTLNGRILLNAPSVEDITSTGSSTKSNKKTQADVEMCLATENDEAHLVGSLMLNGQHKLTLDIDFPCVLEPSSTHGKYHLFIDKPISEEKYKNVVKALMEAGIVEGAIYNKQMLVNGFTSVRLPGVIKAFIDENGNETYVAKPGSYTRDFQF